MTNLQLNSHQIESKIIASEVNQVKKEFAKEVVTACRQEDTTLDLGCILEVKELDTTSLTKNLVAKGQVNDMDEVALKQSLYYAKDSIILNTTEEVLNNPEAYASQSQYFDTLEVAFESTNAVGTFKNEALDLQVGEVSQHDINSMDSGVSVIVGVAIFLTITLAAIIYIVKMLQSKNHKKVIDAKLEQVQKESAQLKAELEATVKESAVKVESSKENKVMKVVHSEVLSFIKAFNSRTVLTAEEVEIFNEENPLNDSLKLAILENHPNFDGIKAIIADLQAMAIASQAKLVVENENGFNHNSDSDSDSDKKQQRSNG